MNDQQRSNSKYRPPAVKRWGTVLDLTSGADKGGSGDPFSAADDDHSIFLPDQANGGNGRGG